MNKPIKALVLAADYSHPDGRIKLHYIHMRNIYYVKHGIDVTVINFRADKAYSLDGIPVITYKDYQADKKQYDVLICHAPNIRNHYRFLKKHQKRFKNIIFVFHGHEVLRLNATYPKPFPFMKGASGIRRAARDAYDSLKLRLWRNYLPKLAPKSRFIFVSGWIKREFFRNTGLTPQSLMNNGIIISNAVGAVFENQSYDANIKKEYDFFTLRSDMDLSKYGVDIVNSLALSNPDLKFLLVGKGNFFSHIAKADNLTWLEGALPHEKIVEMLDKCSCGLMPTRQDTQGLMGCEFAAYGIPLITSDIDVCREVFDGMENVALISNSDTAQDLKPMLDKLTAGVPYKKDTRYFAENTVMKEIDLIKEIVVG
ncbi:MAG: glycosyltransferase [Oscillospiraceae bacterium]|nr:glycosyltransferase [Oscillospiraceae bacterium]MDD4413867.1 glycosyltransferase [Oscillospiraceae bacterium]